MTAPVVVTGATGNVGRAVVASLGAAGVPVRAAVPTVQRVEPPEGEEVAHLDFHDPSTFRPALAGASGLFLLRPPAIARVGPTLNALLDVAAELGVGHVIFSSVAGADTNRVVPHHRVERHLQASGLDYTILRPGFFAQNLGDAYRTDIRRDDRLFVPAGHGRVAFVDVRDLGDVAAVVFADPASHRSRGYTLTGPQAVTFFEVARLLTQTLGRPIRYRPASARAYVGHLRSEGLPAGKIVVQTLLHLGLRRGDAEAVDPTVRTLLGREPRSLETYISDHREVWARDAGAGRATADRQLIERVHPPTAVVRVVNPLVRALLTSRGHGLLSDALLVLHFTGRRTGTRYDLPVGYHPHEGQLEVLTNSGWRANFRDPRPLHVTLRGRRRPACATTIEDPQIVAARYEALIAQAGVARAQRRLGLRINANRPPTRDELAAAVDRLGLSIVRLALRTPAT